MGFLLLRSFRAVCLDLVGQRLTSGMVHGPEFGLTRGMRGELSVPSSYRTRRWWRRWDFAGQQRRLPVFAVLVSPRPSRGCPVPMSGRRVGPPDLPARHARLCTGTSPVPAGLPAAADKHDYGPHDDDAARREVQNPPGQRQREKRSLRQRAHDRRPADGRSGRSAGSVLRSSPCTGALFDARPAAVRPQDGRPGPGDGVRQPRRCLRQAIFGAVGLARAEGPVAAETAPGGVPAPAPAPWHRRHRGHCRRTG
jgi:hypothetical protein